MAQLLSGCLADCSFFPDPHGGPVRSDVAVREARTMSDVIIRSAIDADDSAWVSRGVLKFSMVPLSPRYTAAQLFPQWKHPYVVRLVITPEGARVLRRDGGITLYATEPRLGGSLSCCYADAEASVHCSADGVVVVHLSSVRYPRFWIHASVPMPDEHTTQGWGAR